jgi:hypothetical protein
MKGDRGRRARRLRTRGGIGVQLAPAQDVDPAIETPSLDEILTSIDRMPDPGEWSNVSRIVMPMFIRARPHAFSAEQGELVTVEMPPGVTVGFGLDIGMAFAHVTRDLLSKWDRDLGTLVSQAMNNLRRRAAQLTPDYVIHEPSDSGYTMKGLQAPGGWASTLLLLPEDLERLFGCEPQVFIAPMRALLMSFPADVPRDTVAFFAQEFEGLDPAALRLEAFVLRDGRLTIEPLPRTDPAPEGSQIS